MYCVQLSTGMGVGRGKQRERMKVRRGGRIWNGGHERMSLRGGGGGGSKGGNDTDAGGAMGARKQRDVDAVERLFWFGKKPNYFGARAKDAPSQLRGAGTRRARAAWRSARGGATQISGATVRRRWQRLLLEPRRALGARASARRAARLRRRCAGASRTAAPPRGGAGAREARGRGVGALPRAHKCERARTCEKQRAHTCDVQGVKTGGRARRLFRCRLGIPPHVGTCCRRTRVCLHFPRRSWRAPQSSYPS